MLTLDNCAAELVRTRIMVGAVIASLYGIATFMLPGPYPAATPSCSSS